MTAPSLPRLWFLVWLLSVSLLLEWIFMTLVLFCTLFPIKSRAENYTQMWWWWVIVSLCETAPEEVRTAASRASCEEALGFTHCGTLMLHFVCERDTKVTKKFQFSSCFFTCYPLQTDIYYFNLLIWTSCHRCCFSSPYKLWSGKSPCYV